MAYLCKIDINLLSATYKLQKTFFLINDKEQESITSNGITNIFEPPHQISNNVVCATSKASDQPAHTHSLIRAFASRLNIL